MICFVFNLFSCRRRPIEHRPVYNIDMVKLVNSVLEAAII